MLGIITLTKNAKVIVVTSGKGGVGKTTSTAAIGAEIARRGNRVIVVDFDIGLRNLDLVMGCERRVVYDFVNVINEEASLNQAIIKDKREPNLYVLPASQTRNKDALTKEGVLHVLEQLKKEFDYILCDSPAGIERGALMALHFAEYAIIVTNPEVSSVRDSDRIIGVLNSDSKLALDGKEVQKYLLITRFSVARAKRGEMLSIEDIQEILAIDLLGVIPESQSVLNASNQGVPVTLDAESDAKAAYMHAVDTLIDNKDPIILKESNKWGFIKKFLSRGHHEYS